MGEKGNGKLISRLKQRFTNQLGFTLIELMATLAILAIILLIAVPAIGSIIEKANASADDSSIDLIENAAEKAYIDDKIAFDGPEPDSYTVPHLIEQGYLNLDSDHKFNQPENYVVKKNDGGEFIFNGDGSGEDIADVPYAGMTCEEAQGQDYICIDNETKFNDIRDNMSGKYILMDDIDLAGFSDWAPIGTVENPFKGVLNGNGYSVQNMTITGMETDRRERGLFGVMSHGEIKHLDVSNASIALSNTVYHTQAKSAILVGHVTYWGKTPTGGWVDTNPDNKPLVFSDISLSGDISASRDVFGSLSSEIYVVGDLVIEDVDVDVNVTEARIAGGLALDTYVQGTTYPVDVTVDNIQVDGSISGADRSYGVWSDFYGSDNSGSVTATNIAMNASVAGGSVYGVFGAFYIKGGAYDTLVQNVEMNGSLTATGKLIGFLEYMDSFNDSGTTLIENISLTGSMSAATSAIVFMDSFSQFGSTGAQTIRNINVTSDVESERYVYGFIRNLSANGAKAPVTIEDVHYASAFSASGFMWDGEPVHAIIVDGIDRFNIVGSSDVVIQNLTFANTIVEPADAVVPADYFGFSQFEGARILNNPGNLAIKNIRMDSTVDVKGKTPVFDAGLADNSQVSISATYPDAVISFEGITVGGTPYLVPSIVYTP